MQELIKIEKRVIGAEETNSVNARDLHGVLEIKKDFTDWIKTQISRAGLRKDVDYMVTSQKINREVGSSFRKNYIITTDSSKHIAMMSQGQKAKEVRDYFIAVEKEYRASLGGNGNEILNQIMPVLKSMTEMMQQMVQMQMQMMQQMQQMQQLQLESKKEALTPEQLDNIKKSSLKSCQTFSRCSSLYNGKSD